DAAVSDGDGLVAPDAPSPLGDLTIDVRSDRGTTPAADTSPRRDTGTTNSSGTGGCGCRAAAGGGDTLLLGLLVLLLIARRRRLLP
ncbi:MAG: hypothetical protein KC503_18570, partial [Myxococcales bacterium]|nr:hypothetical protein [Myxococcales bacterium]